MSGFKDVVGHKNIIKYIQNAVTADAVSHAYILNGERGSGKKLLANLFAMSLQCENRDEDGDACGKCRSYNAWSGWLGKAGWFTRFTFGCRDKKSTTFKAFST